MKALLNSLQLMSVPVEVTDTKQYSVLTFKSAEIAKLAKNVIVLGELSKYRIEKRGKQLRVGKTRKKGRRQDLADAPALVEIRKDPDVMLDVPDKVDKYQ